MLQPSKFFAIIITSATLGCGETQHPSQSESDKPDVDAIACCDLPQKAEVEKLRGMAEAGNTDASRRLAYYYSAIDGTEAETEALRWLEAAAARGTASDADRLVYFHLAHGRCGDVEATYSQLKKKVEGYPLPGKTMDSEIIACFKRPVGEGSWQTRRMTGG